MRSAIRESNTRIIHTTRCTRRRAIRRILTTWPLLFAAGCSDIAAPARKIEAPTADAQLKVAAPIDTTRTFYGPVPFAGTAGAPTTYTNSISTIGFTAPFVLHVRNGNVDGSAPASGATVSLDGVVLLAPQDFKKNKVDYAFHITPGPATVLEVQMAGTNTGYVTVWIDGKEHARFCPVATGDGLGYQSLQTAIDTVTPGHTIWVCNGAHAVNEAMIGKPLTIRAENAGMATLVQPATAAAGEAILDVNGTAAGKDAFVDLSLQFTQVGLHLQGTFDSVAVIRTAFGGPGSTCVPGPGAQSIGLVADATTIATAHVGVHRSSFSNSCDGLVSNQPVDFDTYNSTFFNTGSFGLIYFSATGQDKSPTGVPMMRTGRVIGNTFTNCGTGACIAEEDVGVDTISQNHLIMTSGHVTDGIFLNRALEPTAAVTRPAIVTNNVIEGRSLTGVDTTLASWAYTGGIVESQSFPGTTDVIQGNRIADAYAGISARINSILTVSDNTIDSTYVPVFIANGVQIVANRNDFSNYTYPVGGGVLTQTPPAIPIVPALPPASFTCSWWGGAGGPVNMLPGVLLAVYAPYSTVRIAGKPSVTCDPNAIAMTVRACAKTNGSGIPTMPSIPAAYAAVPSGGTVLVCDGSYVTPLLIQKPVTITAEGPGMPTIDAGGYDVIFSVGHVATGPVTISKLRFTGGVSGQVILNASSTTKDGATTNITNNEFHPPHDQQVGGQDWGIYLINQDSGTVNIGSNVFIGGDDGISTAATPGAVVNITGNTFTGQSFSAVAVANTDVNAMFNLANNNFTDCSTNNACVTSSSRLSVVNNSFTAHIGRPVLNAVNITIQNGDLTPSTITNNTVVGIGHHSTDRTAATTYPFQGTAISVTSGIANVSGNNIANAYQGFGGQDGATITAADNVVQTTYAPVAGGGIGAVRLNANWNDFSDYFVGIGDAGALNVGALNLQCNWWGQPTGPTLIYPGVPASAYTPFAGAPVAGQPHTGCTPAAPAGGQAPAAPPAAPAP